MDRPTYHADLSRVYTSGIDFLNKLERGQHFEERGFASWEAFAAGDWNRALSLAGDGRQDYAQELRRANETLTLIAAELAANAVRHGTVPGRDFREAASACSPSHGLRVRVRSRPASRRRSL